MAYRGYPFTVVEEWLKLVVWKKGEEVLGYDPNLFRKDICGNWMRYYQHGEEGKYGWEIDHIYPRALGGQSTLENLQPLWWRNNRRKGDNYPWSC